VMHAAVWILFEKSGDRLIRAKRLEQLDLSIRQHDKSDRDAMFRQG
jgi:hypothetical protein